MGQEGALWGRPPPPLWGEEMRQCRKRLLQPRPPIAPGSLAGLVSPGGGTHSLPGGGSLAGGGRYRGQSVFEAVGRGGGCPHAPAPSHTRVLPREDPGTRVTRLRGALCRSHTRKHACHAPACGSRCCRVREHTCHVSVHGTTSLAHVQTRYTSADSAVPISHTQTRVLHTCK